MEAKYNVKGLGCANCAAKMERGISRIPGVESVAISILTGRMTLAVSSELGPIEEEAAAIMARIEPGVRISRV